VAEGGHLTLVVEGDLRVAGSALLGDPGRDTGQVTVFVGGAGTVSLGAPSSIAGSLIAPRGELVNAAPLTLGPGSLAARRVAAGSDLTVTYDPRLGGPLPLCP
jgi:hypothetical protein